MNSDVANKRHCIRALQQRKAVAIVETPLINEEQAHVFVTHTNAPNKMQFKKIPPIFFQKNIMYFCY